LLIAGAFLGLGIYTGHLWLSVPFGMTTAGAAWAVVSGGRHDLASRRMSRRGLDRRWVEGAAQDMYYQRASGELWHAIEMGLLL
jgi:hypothetical protein